MGCFRRGGIKDLGANADINIKQGDCLELMKEIPNHSIDMICCDLPYAITGKYWDVLIPFDELWKHYKRIIKMGGQLPYFVSNHLQV